MGVEIKALYTHALELREHLKEVKQELETCRKDKREYTNVAHLRSLLEEYKNLRSKFILVCSESYKQITYIPPDVSAEFCFFKSDIKVIPPFPKEVKTVLMTLSDIEDAIAEVSKAVRGCSIIASVCDSLIKPKIPPESLDKLTLLRKELEEMERELPSEINFLVEDIREAIEEYEHGHFLASALIASRVIDYVFVKIPPEGTGDYREKLSELIKMEIVNKDRKDEQENFLRASKLARNIFSHRPWIKPKVDDLLILLGSAVAFLRYLLKLQKTSPLT